MATAVPWFQIVIFAFLFIITSPLPPTTDIKGNKNIFLVMRNIDEMICGNVVATSWRGEMGHSVLNLGSFWRFPRLFWSSLTFPKKPKEFLKKKKNLGVMSSGNVTKTFHLGKMRRSLTNEIRFFLHFSSIFVILFRLLLTILEIPRGIP